MSKIFTFLLILIVSLGMTRITFPEKAPTIYMIGDSTMADKPDTPDINPERGWGQLLHEYFTEEIIVENHAVNGRSSKSFINEGRWQVVKDKIEEGDYVIIQFGHNDQKYKDPTRFTNPSSTYYNNLAKFVNETRSKGGIPVLVSSIVRRKFNELGTLEDTHGLYPLVTRMVANDMEVPFIDLQYETEVIVQREGVEESKKIYLHLTPGEYEKFPDGLEDNTHLSLHGAKLYAGLFVNRLKEFKLPINHYIKGKI